MELQEFAGLLEKVLDGRDAAILKGTKLLIVNFASIEKYDCQILQLIIAIYHEWCHVMHSELSEEKIKEMETPKNLFGQIQEELRQEKRKRAMEPHLI